MKISVSTLIEELINRILYFITVILANKMIKLISFRNNLPTMTCNKFKQINLRNGNNLKFDRKKIQLMSCQVGVVYLVFWEVVVVAVFVLAVIIANNKK